MSTKIFSPIGSAVWPAIRNIYTNVLFYIIDYKRHSLNHTESHWFRSNEPKVRNDNKELSYYYK